MTDADVANLQTKIDAELATRTNKNVGIMFGFEAYAAFFRRDLFAYETFSLWGTGALPTQILAYKKRHAVSCDLNLPNTDCRVGKDT